MSNLLPPPSKLGLPYKFSSWRDGQDQMVLDVVESPDRFVCVAAPTGSGKSVTYVSVAQLAKAEARTLILTGSKALQDQLGSDFSAIGLVDVRGRRNFRCSYGGDTCEDGAVLRCPDCPYRIQVDGAKQARMVRSNYDFWISIRESQTSIGKFDYLFLDEAHIADEKVCSSLEIILLTATIYKELRLRFPNTKSIRIWRKWAAEAVKIAAGLVRDQEARFDDMPGSPDPEMLRRLTFLRRLLGDLVRLSEARGYWVLSNVQGGYRWSILWAAPYAEQVLFRQIPHVGLFSATLVKKSVTLLGIDEDSRSYQEYPFTFPAERCRIIHVPTARLSNRASEADWAKWVSNIDAIIRKRLDRKGLIHTISYANRNRLLKSSAYSRYMVTHDRDNTADVIAKFELMDPPAILVSPSIETGYDFAGQKAEYQIIGKLPFADTRETVIRARQEVDPEYGHHLMVQRLVQACGRIMRSADDQGETFIVDDNILWAINRFRRLYPAWFLRLVRLVQPIPNPPPPLSEGIKQRSAI